MIIADIADQMGIVPYQMATQGDLDETVSQVEALDRRILAIKADARDRPEPLRLTCKTGHGYPAAGGVTVVERMAGLSRLGSISRSTAAVARRSSGR